MNPYPHLFSPLRVGPLRFKNRILAAPTQIRQKDPNGHMNDYGIAYFEAKAKGGAAQVTIGDTPVEPLYGATQFYSFQLDDPGALASLSEVAAAIHQHGAIASLELSHGGKISVPAYNHGNDPMGPMELTLPNGTHVRAMDQAMVDYIVEKFAQGAKTIQKCGFDMCTIHAGHGWLLGQFLSPLTNQRTDDYGGSLEKRARLTLEVVEAVRRACGKNFIIELRISGDEFVSGGLQLEDMVEFCKMLEDKVDMLHVSAGLHGVPSGLMRMFPSNLLPHGSNVYLAARIKEAVSIPVATVGAISSPEEAEEIIASGQADFVSMGRALIADPDFPNKARRGQAVRPCLRCLNCLKSMNDCRHLSCAVNPTVSSEHRISMPQPTTPKRVLVIGGGPAGMTAAITARQRGHEVLLCEKSERLGGLLVHADTDPRKEDLLRYKQYLIGQTESSGAEIRTGVTVTKEFLQAYGPDAVICAVGSRPLVPPVPGMEKAMSAMDAHREDAVIGDRVVIIGGGLVGCETALFLVDQGKQVALLEMAPALAQEDAPLHRMVLLQAMGDSIEKYTGCRCTGITEYGVEAVDAKGQLLVLPADSVICAAGMRANTDIVDGLETGMTDFYPVGDCNRARKIHDAVAEGYFAALAL